jgi:hypothetical protein
VDDLSLVRDHTVLSVVAGSRAYGLATEASDVDLRGVHLMPVEDVVGLRAGQETVDRTWTRDGVEVDLVTHDLAKFGRLEEERDRSSLPERPSAGPALHDLVVRARLADLPHVNSRSQG